jgi:hypothetical protein
MKYTKTVPCKNCPFMRKGGIRLKPERAEEIGNMFSTGQGGEFPCHKTTVSIETEDGCDRAATKDSLHCAGALIFAEKQGTPSQMMRICERIGMYDAAKLMKNKKVVALVFDDLDEMLEANQ